MPLHFCGGKLLEEQRKEHQGEKKKQEVTSKNDVEQSEITNTNCEAKT